MKLGTILIIATLSIINLLVTGATLWATVTVFGIISTLLMYIAAAAATAASVLICRHWARS